MNFFTVFFASQLYYYKYAIAFPLAIVEGPVLMVACGFLLKLGVFHFWPIYLILVLGDFVADMVWYWVGRYGGLPIAEKWGKYFGLDKEAIEKVTKIFHKYHEKILIISKITMGFGFAVVTLFVAGMVKISFKKYALINFFGGFIWTGLLLLVGYLFGNLFTAIDKGFRIAFIVFVAGLVLAALYGMNKYFRNKALNRLS